LTELALLYEHPQWLAPVLKTLDRRGIGYKALHADGHSFDPADLTPPASLIFNRVAMSSFLREADHPIFYAQAVMAHWRAAGARIINGGEIMGIDASKARQLSLMASLGLSVPATRVVHRKADIADAASGLRFPIVIKANIGGSGAGILRYDSLGQLREFIADGLVPESIDRVWLVQEYVPVRDHKITRLETMGGKFLYAIDVDGGGGFDLCPADACLIAPGKAAVKINRADPSPDLIEAAERISRAADMDIGGIVANPLDVLGWDPHENLVDWLESMIEKVPA
jgi:hypothetical protein